MNPRTDTLNSRPARADGFTLIELLTVIAIIGILAAILIPVASRVRESAGNAKCVSNVRHWGQAILLYAEEHDGTYAVRQNWSATAASDPGLGDGDGGAGYGFAPWASTTSDYNKYYLELGQATRDFRVCPLERENPTSVTYALSWPSIGGVEPPRERVPLSSAVDPSGLLLFSDSAAWGSGDDTTHMAIRGAQAARTGGIQVQRLTNSEHIDKRHRGKMNAAFADGHVRHVHWAASNPNDANSFVAQWDRWTTIR